MSQTNPLNAIKVESIFHPSDFSQASEIAFAHALKTALVTKAKLNMLHVTADSHAEWHDFPGVRDTLERWKLIPKGSPRSVVGQLGLDVRKVMTASKDPVKACLEYMAKHPADLIVLAVRQHEGRMRWLEKSVGEPIARGAGQMTLFIPHGVEGFVSRADGSVSLRNILIPVVSKPRPQPAAEATARLIRNLQLPEGTVTLLHAGTAGDMPAMKLPEDTGWTWNRVARAGEPVDVILQAAKELATDLIVMTTDGPDGFLDGLRGTTSERVLRKARCPVANLPVGSMITNVKMKVAVAGVMVLALLMVPAPLPPPHWLAEAVQSALGVSWKAAYLAAAVGLQVAFYGSIGLLAALAVNRAPTLRRRLLQIMVAPLVVIGVAVVIRSLKLGHVPMLANAVIPVAACLFGVGLGLGRLYRGWKVTLFVAVAVIGAALWVFLGGASAELSRATEAHLQRLVAAGPSLTAGDARFGSLLQTAFAPLPANATQGKAVQHNRAAILVLGIAIGHERLARFAGLDANGELVRGAIALRQGTTLRGREDWARHYALSAALAVLEHPLVSDAGGLIKEELDALTHGSGFSFGDLAADRAGVRFAIAATCSEVDEQAMQARLHRGFAVDDFFPQTTDLPENLTVEQFRGIYGGVGSQRYRQVVADIEARLDGCAALSPRHSP